MEKALKLDEISKLKKEKNIYIIGLGGITRSGKSSLAKILKQNLNIIGCFDIDHFYYKNVIKKDKNGQKFVDEEDPGCYNLEKLYSSVVNLITSTEKVKVKNKENINYIILEGFLIYYLEKYCEIIEIALCLFIKYEVCKERREKTRGFRDNEYFDKLIWDGWHERNKLFESYFPKEKKLEINNYNREETAKICLEFIKNYPYEF